MILRPLSKEYMEQIRGWRNRVPEALRTPFMLTKEMQEDYYEKEICNRESKTRYWAILMSDYPSEILIGYGGIENIQWENRIGEISLLINPDSRGKGHGKEAVRQILDQAFNYINLDTVFGECYSCNPGYKFWLKMCSKYNAIDTTLPRRKYFDGKYYDSIYFTIKREDFING